MTSVVSVPIPTADFLALASFLRERGDPRDPVEVIREAVIYWQENAEWKSVDLMPEATIDRASRGFMWKHVFLPEGTVLRMKYAGQYHYAKVEGDDIFHRNEPFTPNQFATKITGGSRDAWRDLWVKRPCDGDYIPANALRSQE